MFVVLFVQVVVRSRYLLKMGPNAPFVHNINIVKSGAEPRQCLGTATTLQSGRFGVRIPIGAGDFSVIQNVQTDSGVHPGSCSMCTGNRSWGQRGRDVKLAEVKEWNCTSTPVCVLGVDRKQFTLKV